MPKESLLAGQSVIVVGGGRGIGRAAAEMFARYGASVVVAARSVGQLQSTVNAITAAHGQALAVPMDVGDPKAGPMLLETTLDAYGKCDALINAAAVNGPIGDVEKLDRAEWELALRTNLTGTFLTCGAVLPEMKKRGRGKILNVSSGLAVRAQAGMAAYSAAKAAVLQFSRVLAEETKDTGVKVNAIHPGIVRTALVEEIISLPAEGARRSMIENLTRLRDEGSLLNPEETAEFFLWLVAACERNGEFIRIDDPGIKAEVAAFASQLGKTGNRWC